MTLPKKLSMKEHADLSNKIRLAEKALLDAMKVVSKTYGISAAKPIQRIVFAGGILCKITNRLDNCFWSEHGDRQIQKSPYYGSFLADSIAWISTTESLPDSEIIVLISIPSPSEPVWFGYHDGDQWRTSDGMSMAYEVTHWAELPEGPKS